jgi:ubiquinone/menaquinone biosynthesis C-methylase UbiE
MSLEMNRRTLGRFDRWARTYDRGRLRPWFTQGQDRALEALELPSVASVLDVGCGTGWATLQTARQVPAARACGVDLSPGMIRRAVALAEGVANVEFRVADAEALPYAEATFDAVLCCHSFHHYSEPLRALDEIRRVLRPRGRFVLLESDRAGCPWVWAWDRFLRIFERGHVKYYTEAELLRLLVEAGFVQPVVVGRDHGHLRRGKVGWADAIIRAEKS